jgi:hypothetical protein
MKKVLRLVQLYLAAVMCISLCALLESESVIWIYVFTLAAFGGVSSMFIKA